MILLRLAAFTCAAATLFLNATYGWATSFELSYAVVMTAISIAIDIFKSTLLLVALRLAREGAPLRAAIAFLMFWPCFAYSLHAGLSQVALNRETVSAAAEGAFHTHQRILDDYDRVSRNLATMQQSQTYLSTSACARARLRSAKDFCEKVADTQASLAKLSATLSGASPPEPDPQLTLFAAITGWSMSTLKFFLSLWPILLAELGAGVGFALSARTKATQNAPKWFWRRSPRSPPSEPKTQPQSVPMPVSPRAAVAAPAPPPQAPAIVWPSITRAVS